MEGLKVLPSPPFLPLVLLAQGNVYYYGMVEATSSPLVLGLSVRCICDRVSSIGGGGRRISLDGTMGLGLVDTS